MLSVEVCQLYDNVPVPSGSGESSVILKVLPTAALPSIEKVASPLSTNGMLTVEVVTISPNPCPSL